MLRACVELGIEPIIEEVEVSDESLELMVNEDFGLDMEDERSLGDLIEMMQREYCFGRTITFEQLQQAAVA